VLVITTPEKAEEHLLTRLYPVRDLVLVRGVADNSKSQVYEDYDSLINVIESIVAPDTWETVGGPGGVERFRNAEALVISQTYRVHHQVKDLLADLRAVRKHQGIIPLAAEPVPLAARTWSQPPRNSWRIEASASQPSRRIVYQGGASWRVPQLHQ
jgi:hypothetical protein